MLAVKRISALRIGAVSAIVAGLICLHAIGVLGPIETVWRWALTPATAAMHDNRGQLAVPDNLQQKSVDELRQLVLELQARHDDVVVENAGLRQQLADAGLLKQQLDFLQEQSYSTIQAKVTSRLAQSISPQLTINRGASSGITEGAAVLGGAGILVGTVSAVDQTTATVLLLNSVDSEITAVIQNDATSQGIITGDFNVLLQMQLLPQFDPINVSDIIVTSGADAHIPAGLVIGTVQSVAGSAGELFQTATVSPAFSPEHISLVSVVKL